MSKLEDLFGTPQPVALVTGAGKRRVGHAIVLTLAARGYHVAVHAHRSLSEAKITARQLTANGGHARAFQADISNEAEVASLVENVFDYFERINVLVNCAAIWEPGRLEDIGAAELRRHWETNTLGTFLCCQHVGQVLIGQPFGGAIVNVGDWATARPYADYAAYFCSKGAIGTMTRSLAVELAQRNRAIRVNAVLPGPVTLPAEMPAEDRRRAIDASLLKREGSPQNVADAVVALIENDFITGVCLPVDGGRSIYSA